MEIPIIYEDNHIIVVQKPPGIPSQEDETGDADMLTLLKEDIKIRYEKPGNVYLGLVHRLDRPVGGAMLFAKTSKAASRLSEAVRSRSFDKTYICVVEGVPSTLEADLLHYIVKDTRKNQVTVYNAPTQDSKDAKLSYKVLHQANGRSLVAIKLYTGRPHQIRAQMAHIGCPLVGDQKYGKVVQQRYSQIALWSTSITVAHPTTKEPMSFQSIPPEQQAPWSLFSLQQLTQAAQYFL
ncbi:MAG TPA: RluA family pseudouridine synthase [Candidatus Paenibacillus intestinavium]|nr:RluA family pseudouridine synthase [Candidatus Paenibacillus intestinavium]